MENDNDPSIVAILDQRLNIQQYKLDLMEKRMLHAGKLFTIPLRVMAHQTSVPIDILEQIVNAVAESMVPEVFEFRHSPPRSRFNDPILDRLLILPESGIFEISGQAGSGKSHLAYQLAVNERLHDMARSVVLISTEGKVATQRLIQMASRADFAVDDILSGIVISEADSVDQLREIVQTSLPARFFDESHPPPSLVIIDSIAALFRIEYDANAVPDRSRILFDITTTLKWISTVHNALIVVTNQATANMSAFATNPDEWVPALGLSWANCVNVRVRITKTNLRHETVSMDGGGAVRSSPAGETAEAGPSFVPIRTIYVEISPLRQGVRGQFFIDTFGVHGL
jgi:DNA-repair protein XRCC3